VVFKGNNELRKICTVHSRAILSRINRIKTVFVVSAKLSYWPHCRLSPISSGTELSAVVFGQPVHAILIVVTVSSGVCLEDKT
jgi:hypothetical protein